MIDMRKNIGKWYFVFFMFCCLVGMLLITSDKTETNVDDPKEAEGNSVVLDNDSLFIQHREGDIIYIGGEGKLNSTDMYTLLGSAGISSNDISDLIIGDGITEVGYNTITNYKYLRTLRIGKDVISLNNGSIRNCPALEYVFLPSGLEHIGIDNMYGSNNYFIISDGSENTLPDIQELDYKYLLDNICSYTDLKHRLSEIPDYIFKSDTLYTTDPGERFNPIVLRPKYTQYGPYIGLEKGDYRILIYGENLSALSNANIYAINENNGIMIKNVVIKESTISYSFSLAEKANAVECCIKNTTENAVQIERLEIFSDHQDDIPNAIQYWW